MTDDPVELEADEPLFEWNPILAARRSAAHHRSCVFEPAPIDRVSVVREQRQRRIGHTRVPLRHHEG